MHLVAGAVLLLGHRDGLPPVPDARTRTLELVEIAPLPASESRSESSPRIADAGAPGGGANASSRREPGSAATLVAARARKSSARSSVSEVDPRGAIRFERAERGSDVDGGLGVGGHGVSGVGSGVGGLGGAGEGRGNGLGMGAGGSLVSVPPPPEAPRGEPVVSKARPARLVYPKRNRGVDDGETFIARVTIDEDGYVVGARLVRGFGGRRDEEAAGLIFRFRYAPALDDAGRPIRSTLDQNFLVE